MQYLVERELRGFHTWSNERRNEQVYFQHRRWPPIWVIIFQSNDTLLLTINLSCQSLKERVFSKKKKKRERERDMIMVHIVSAWDYQKLIPPSSLFFFFFGDVVLKPCSNCVKQLIFAGNSLNMQIVVSLVCLYTQPSFLSCPCFL